MEIKKTDSLGIEILTSISQDETGNAIKPVKTKEEAIENKEEAKLTLFEVYEAEEVVGYFTIETETYNKWVQDYKLEGVEI